MMLLHTLLLRPIPSSVTARVREYATVLGVDDGVLRAAEHFADGAYGLAAFDFERAGYTVDVEPGGAPRRCTRHASSKRPGRRRPTTRSSPRGGRRSARCRRERSGRGVWELYRARGLRVPRAPRLRTAVARAARLGARARRLRHDGRARARGVRLHRPRQRRPAWRSRCSRWSSRCSRPGTCRAAWGCSSTTWGTFAPTGSRSASPMRLHRGAVSLEHGDRRPTRSTSCGSTGSTSPTMQIEDCAGDVQRSRRSRTRRSAPARSDRASRAASARSSWPPARPSPSARDASTTTTARPPHDARHMTQEPIRVLQWTTGNVGSPVRARAIAANPGLDARRLLRLERRQGRPRRRRAGRDRAARRRPPPNDVDALLALQPDCVSYNPLWPDVDEMCRILAAGVNVVTTSAFITGRWLGDERDRPTRRRARDGGVTLFGSRDQPGLRQPASPSCPAGSATASTGSRCSSRSTPPATRRPRRSSRSGSRTTPTIPRRWRRPTALSIVFDDAVALIGRRARSRASTRSASRSSTQPPTQDIDLGVHDDPRGHVAGIDACLVRRGRRAAHHRVPRPLEDGRAHGARLAAAPRLLRRGRGSTGRAQPAPDPARPPTGTSPTSWASA